MGPLPVSPLLPHPCSPDPHLGPGEVRGHSWEEVSAKTQRSSTPLLTAAALNHMNKEAAE